MAAAQTARRQGGRRLRGGVRSSAPGLPLVTVITVVFNGQASLAQAMASVQSQSYGNIEYIIIDGGSTDRSLEIIESFGEAVDYWLSEADHGIYEAMNKGIGLARGELIGLLNADDYYEPEAVRWVVAEYVKEPAAAIFYGNNYVVQEDLKLRYKSYPHMKYWLGMCLCHQAMFVHREVYQAIGLYDGNYGLAADYELILRAFFKKIPYRHVNKFLVNYRNTGLSSHDYLRSIGEAKHIHQRYFPRLNFARAVYLLRYYKTFGLFYGQKIIHCLLGAAVLNSLRRLYLLLFYAKERETWK